MFGFFFFGWDVLPWFLCMLCLVLPCSAKYISSLRPAESLLPSSGSSSSSVESVTLPVGEKEAIDQAAGSMAIAVTSSDETGDEGHPLSSHLVEAHDGDDQLNEG